MTSEPVSAVVRTGFDSVKCYRCGGRVAKFRHSDLWEPADNHGFFKQWGRCQGCNLVIRDVSDWVPPAPTSRSKLRKYL
jgi:hypothetical protein